MVTRESFFEEFNGHYTSYSSFLLINTTVEAVINLLNDIDESMRVGSGYESNGNVGFEICKESPLLIYELTRKLKTTGYADIDWDSTYTVCAKDGLDFDDYSAEWEPNMFYYRGDFDEDDNTWDAFVRITDNATGTVFHTGAGGVDEETMNYYRKMVESH